MANRRTAPGDRFGKLVVIGYRERDTNGSRVEVECDCGNRKVLALRNLRSGATTDCADRSKHPNPRALDDCQINTWHKRLVTEYGPARTHPCAFCGVITDGNVWAYRHSSSEARSQLVGKDRGQVFAPGLEHYFVLCRSHHHRFDEAHRNVAVSGFMSLPHIAMAAAYRPTYERLT